MACAWDRYRLLVLFQPSHEFAGAVASDAVEVELFPLVSVQIPAEIARYVIESGSVGHDADIDFRRPVVDQPELGFRRQGVKLAHETAMDHRRVRELLADAPFLFFNLLIVLHTPVFRLKSSTGVVF